MVGVAQLNSPPICRAVFAGPPDPLHGNSLYQKVRAAAQVSLGPRSLPALPAQGPGSTLQDRAPEWPSGEKEGWGNRGLAALSALCLV